MRDRWLSAALSAIAVMPILWLPVASLVMDGRSGVGSLEEPLPAYLNSVLLSFIVASIAWSAAYYLVFLRRAAGECIIYSALLFFLPGDLVAKGLDRLINVSFGPLAPHAIEVMALLLANIGYVFPFVSVVLIILFVFAGPSTFESLDEVYPIGMAKAWVLARAFWPQLLMAWLVGFNLCLAEAIRTGTLAEDVFGLGGQYFGPKVADAFATGGVNLALMFLSLVPLVPFAVIALLLRKRT